MEINTLSEMVNQAFGNSVNISNYNAVGGGCINQCYQLQINNQYYFIKCNKAQLLDMFDKEHDGLIALAKYSEINVPRAINIGTVEGNSYLLMEFVPSSTPNHSYWEKLGEGLSNMHQQTAEQFGWKSDNYIGRLPQSNRFHEDWIEFFIQERLNFQIKLARDAHLLPTEVLVGLERICQSLDQHLNDESPSFLHGDLWSGNIMTGPEGEPWLVDPAVYYGNREIEMAFTTLFGGFDEKFYQAYNHSFPLVNGYRDRFDIYNLYPLLVHLNLFESGYLANIKQIVRRYSA